MRNAVPPSNDRSAVVSSPRQTRPLSTSELENLIRYARTLEDCRAYGLALAHRQQPRSKHPVRFTIEGQPVRLPDRVWKATQRLLKRDGVSLQQLMDQLFEDMVAKGSKAKRVSVSLAAEDVSLLCEKLRVSVECETIGGIPDELSNAEAADRWLGEGREAFIRGGGDPVDRDAIDCEARLLKYLAQYQAQQEVARA